uniref:Genome polyprotein n=1 Tax=Bundaberg bee virus 7 TaxID=2201290 RepID=A0A2U8JQ84_9VIRU|nr:polyprotein [Bundaberg bee virus 7]
MLYSQALKKKVEKVEKKVLPEKKIKTLEEEGWIPAPADYFDKKPMWGYMVKKEKKVKTRRPTNPQTSWRSQRVRQLTTGSGGYRSLCGLVTSRPFLCRCSLCYTPPKVNTKPSKPAVATSKKQVRCRPIEIDWDWPMIEKWAPKCMKDVPWTYNERSRWSFRKPRHFVVKREKPDLTADLIDEEIEVVDWDDLDFVLSESGARYHEYDVETDEDLVSEKEEQEPIRLASLRCRHTVDSYRLCPCTLNKVFRYKGRKTWYMSEGDGDVLRMISREIEFLRSRGVPVDVFKNLWPVKLVNILYTEDQYMVPYDENYDMTRYSINVIRKFLGRQPFDFKYNDNFDSQTMLGQGFIDSSKEFIRKIANYLKFEKDIGTTIKNIVRKVTDSIIGFIGMVSDLLARVIDKILGVITNTLLKIFNPSEFIQNALRDAQKNTIIAWVIFIFTMTALSALTVVGVGVIWTILDFMRAKFWPESLQFVDEPLMKYQRDMEMKAHGHGSTESAVVSILSTLAIIFGCTGSRFDGLVKRFSQFCWIFRGATAMTSVATGLLLLFPEAIRSMLLATFGTQEDKDAILVEDWMVRATALHRLKKINKVLTSQQYYDWARELVKEAQLFRNQIKTSVVGNQFVRMLGQLMDVLSILENYRKEKSYRDLPYSIHLAASPGVGKTLISTRILTDITGLDQSDIYTVPVSSEYWDGYHEQKLIIMDEFLIGDATAKLQTGKVYLELISTKCFKPPMASVDDPSIGLKGTTAEPKLVLSVNNDLYARVDGIPDPALFRRRNVVVLAQIAQNYRDKCNGATIDLSKLTEEELQEKSWLTFTLCPAEPQKGEKISGLTYAMFIQHCRDHYDHHQQTCQRIKRDVQGCIEEDKTVQEMFEETLRDIRGIPKERRTIIDCFMSYFSDSDDMKAQGVGQAMNDQADHEERSSTTTTGGASTSFRRTAEMDAVKRRIELISPLKSTYKNQRSANAIIDIFNKVIEKEQWNQGWEDLVIKLYARIDEVDQAIATIPVHGRSRPTSSSDSSATVKDQKDMVAWWDHQNVDPTKLHRHECLCIVDHDKNGRVVYCNRQFTHKHPTSSAHDMACKECKEAGRQHTWNAMSAPLPPHVDTHKAASYPDPQCIDYAYTGEPDEVRNQLQRTWLKIAWDHFRRFGSVPLITFVGCDATLYMFPLGDELGAKIKQCRDTIIFSIALYLLIVGGVYVYNKYVKGEEVADQPVIFAQSDRRVRESSSRVRKIKWNRGNMKAQASNMLTYSLNGGVHWHRAVPVQGMTFMTHSHAVMDILPKAGETCDLQVNWQGKIYHSKLSLEQIVMNEQEDLMFVTMRPCGVPPFKNIVPKFWTREEMEAYRIQPVSVDCSQYNIYAQCSLKHGMTYTFNNTRYHPTVALVYAGTARFGDCGTPIIAAGSANPGRLMGIHIAGGTNEHGLPICMGIPVCQEDIREALEVQDIVDLPSEFQAQGINANLKRTARVPRSEQVFMNVHTKLEPSSLSASLPYPPRKVLPILSKSDPRAEGVDVLDKMVEELADHNPEIEVDETVLGVLEDMKMYYHDNLKFPIGKRELTWEESLQGVPGKLSSLTVKTSAGFPLCKTVKKQGKKELFWFDENGNLKYDKLFKTMVELEEVKILQGEVDHRFLGFMKDELVAPRKIREKRVRLIYCGDVRHNIIWRKYFGFLLSAFNQSWADTPMMIGLNPNSYDMDVMYQRLHEVGQAENLFAGDFKGFDKHYLRFVTEQIYSILMSFAPHVQENIKRVFVEEQIHSPIQIVDKLVWFVAFQASGGLFTTIVNCLTADFYLRYAFKRSMEKAMLTFIYDDEIRTLLMGDDHVVSVSDRVAPYFNPLTVRDALLEIHQVYTSDDKEAELTPDFRKFSEVTFLGCHPVVHHGRWLGALKKEVIEEMLHWTRNGNLTLKQELVTAVEYASAWGEDYYMYIRGLVYNHLIDFCGYKLPSVSWRSMISVVANRSVSGGSKHPMSFIAHGPERSVVQMNSLHSVLSQNRPGIGKDLTSTVLGDASASIEFGTESRILRGEVTWKTSDPVGTAIWSSKLPGDMLTMVTTNTIQNMPFDRFVYYNFDTLTVSVQINASPFQNGLLALYFMPHSDKPTETANITSTNHVLIQPDQSATCDLVIPYRYMKPCLSTTHFNLDVIGTVFLTPISVLKNDNISDVTVSVYLSFQGAKFYIPRPVSVTSYTGRRYTTMGEVVTDTDLEGVSFEAHGGAFSRNTTINNTILGTAPNQTIDASGNSSSDLDFSPEVSIPLPMDNPPLASGAVPVEQAFPGMATSFGVKSTRDLQLMPATLSRQQVAIFDPSETKIETLLGRSCLLTRFLVSEKDPNSTEKLLIDMDSTFSLAAGSGIPINVAILNQFIFWKSDIELTFMSVQTRYHSMRLQLVVAYGALDIDVKDRSASYSSMMNFSQDNYKHVELIPWNSQTEFLRTFEGKNQFLPITNYSLGKIGVFVQNALRAPGGGVSTDVEVLVFIRFLNPKVAVPRPSPLFSWSNEIYGGLEARASEITFAAHVYTTQRDVKKVGGTVIKLTTNTLSDWVAIISCDNFTPLGNPGFYQVKETGKDVQLTYTKQGTSVTLSVVSLNIDVPNGNYMVNLVGTTSTPEFANDGTLTLSKDLHFQRSAMMVAHGASDPLTTEEKTNESVEDGPSDVLTSTTERRSNVACQIEKSLKFEFCVSDVHEVARRYVFCDFRSGDSAVSTLVYLNGVQGYNRTNAVMPYSIWSLLFAGWAGSMKYRFYTLSDTLPAQISYVPYMSDKSPVAPFIFECASAVNVLGGEASTGRLYNFSLPLASEVAYPISKTNYIDVSCPFQSHYSYLMTQTIIAGQAEGGGVISYSYIQDSDLASQVPVVYTAFGDDMRLGIFRPPVVCTFSLTHYHKGVGGVFTE